MAPRRGPSLRHISRTHAASSMTHSFWPHCARCQPAPPDTDGGSAPPEMAATAAAISAAGMAVGVFFAVLYLSIDSCLSTSVVYSATSTADV